MSNKKILFIDIDGTLVDYNNVLPISAIDAIHNAQNNGHLVYACTGRSKAENKQEIWDIGLNGIICGNGNYIESDGVVVFHQLIPADEERRVVDWLDSRNLCFYLESNNGLFASKTFATDALAACRAYARGKGAPNADSLQTTALFHGMVEGENLYRDDVNKISFPLHTYQDHLDSAREFPDLTAGTWGGKGEDALFGDLGVKNITKAFAVNKLLDYLDRDIEDTIAFGDAKVDIPMFEVCKQSCCMGSGGAEAKAAADYVTTAVDDDGLWNAFVHFGLIDDRA